MAPLASAPSEKILSNREMAHMNLSFGCGLLYCIIVIPSIFFFLHNPLLFWQHVVTAAFVLILTIYVNLTKRSDIGRLGMVILTVQMAAFLVLTGYPFNTGIYVMFPVYIFIFFLTDAKRGSRIIFFLFALFLTAYILNWFTLVPLPYTKLNFGVFLFCYLLAFIFFVAYARQKDQLDSNLHTALKKNEDLIDQLKLQNATIEREVQERTHELTEAKAELLASIRSLPFGFALIRENKIVFSNAQLAKLLGHSSQQTKSTNVPLLFEDVAKDLSEAVMLPTLIQQSQMMRTPIERSITYNKSFFRLFTMPIIDTTDKAIGTVLIIEDTTQQKILERSREEFFSLASHELRTPITAIRGNMSMALQYYGGEIKNSELYQMLKDSHNASIRLIKIVNDFLDASRLEQGKLKFRIESFDVAPLINEVQREYEKTLMEHGFALKMTGAEQHPPQALADSDKTRQIIVNLLSNAMKYTPDKGTITINIQTTGTMLKIQIIDTGQGIPVQSQHLLFRKFQQATNNTFSQDTGRSTGLGLYISGMMAEGMKGRLYLEASEVGKGSIFTLELPATANPSTPQPLSKPLV